MCLSGVAALELFDSSTNTFSLALLSKLGTGDALSLLQAVGFGTGVVSRDSSVPSACVWLIHFPDVIATRRGKVNASILARNSLTLFFYHFIRSLFLPRTHQHVQFLSEKMMKKEPDQALPITAGLVTTTAFFAMVWCLADGWMTNPGWEAMGLPGLFMDADMRTVVRVRIHFYGPSFRLFVRY